MHVMHSAHRARLHPFLGKAGVLGSGGLHTHLRGNALLPGGFRKQPGFVKSTGEWLSTVNMLAEVHCCHGDDSVGMVRSADDNAIDLFVLVEHLAVVTICLGTGVAREGSGCEGMVHVAKGDNVLTLTFAKIASAHRAHAYACKIQFVAGRRSSLAAKDVGRNNRKCGCNCGGSGPTT